MKQSLFILIFGLSILGASVFTYSWADEGGGWTPREAQPGVDPNIELRNGGAAVVKEGFECETCIGRASNVGFKKNTYAKKETGVGAGGAEKKTGVGAGGGKPRTGRR